MPLNIQYLYDHNVASQLSFINKDNNYITKHAKPKHILIYWEIYNSIQLQFHVVHTPMLHALIPIQLYVYTYIPVRIKAKIYTALVHIFVINVMTRCIRIYFKNA